ncbi:MAG: hypothetical protein ABEH90_05425 [Halolamina sp.]
MLLRALAFVTGIVGAVAPRKVIDVTTRMVLAGYENPEDLEPAEWYVEAVRIKFGLVAAAALIAPFLPTPGDDETADGDGPVVDVVESSAEE